MTRTRWLAVKLTGVGAASIASVGLLSFLLSWWAGPLDQITGNRFAAMTFASRDIVPFAYAAFAFALGSTVGVLMRRTVPAMAVTLAVFIGIQILVPTTIRPNLLPATTDIFPVNAATASQAQRKVISPADFADLGALKDRLERFEDGYNQTARPLDWRFTCRDLDAVLQRLDAHPTSPGHRRRLTGRSG